ncbi:MAG: class I SAM-dependent RNA methyltransferase [Moraxellaceae bacterium]|nr:MAG: class I SAM-dependent RNA methyltransferase [Moraxellaceae bacterium]
MRLSEQFTGTVRALTSEGNGVVDHPCGRVVFVPGVWIGELVEAKITQIKNQFALSELVQIITAHPKRRIAPCPYHGPSAKHCGGCPWQFIDYDEQLQAKQERVAHAVHRLDPTVEVQPIVPSQHEFAYRNRAQLKSLGNQLGFVAGASHRLVEVEQCLLLTPKCGDQLRAVQAQVKAQPQSSQRKQPWVTWDINENEFRSNQRLPFAQGNSAQNAYMQQWLKQQLQACNRDYTVLELFAGSGNFTQILASEGFTSVVAVDVVAEAIDTLNAQNLPGVSAQVVDLFKEGALAYLLKRTKPKIVVLDPPRDGLKTVDQLQAKNTAINTILYISCDLATFIRDAQSLNKQGFRLAFTQPLDMFPQTPHVELLARFVRR